MRLQDQWTFIQANHNLDKKENETLLALDAVLFQPLDKVLNKVRMTTAQLRLVIGKLIKKGLAEKGRDEILVNDEIKTIMVYRLTRKGAELAKKIRGFTGYDARELLQKYLDKTYKQHPRNRILVVGGEATKRGNSFIVEVWRGMGVVAKFKVDPNGTITKV